MLQLRAPHMTPESLGLASTRLAEMLMSDYALWAGVLAVLRTEAAQFLSSTVQKQKKNFSTMFC